MSGKFISKHDPEITSSENAFAQTRHVNPMLNSCLPLVLQFSSDSIMSTLSFT